MGKRAKRAWNIETVSGAKARIEELEEKIRLLQGSIMAYRRRIAATAILLVDMYKSREMFSYRREIKRTFETLEGEGESVSSLEVGE